MPVFPYRIWWRAWDTRTRTIATSSRRSTTWARPLTRTSSEYRRRSPAWNAEKLRTPLLIHTTTNDRDVNVIEVEHLIAQLKAAGKEFKYKIYKDAPGGHSFNRTDTALARESRNEIYAFLAKYLK